MKDKSKQIYDLILELYENKKNKELVEKCNKYLEITPVNDKHRNIVRFLRAKSLRYLGCFDETLEELKKLLNEEKDNIHFKLELFHVYYYLNRYEDAIKLLSDLYNSDTKFISNHSLLIAELVMRKQLGMSISFKRGSRSDYVKQQIVDYDEKLALDHIISHMGYEINFNDHCTFSENVDINYLMESVKKSLKNNKKINTNDFLELHIFGVYGIGFNENIPCNYLKVVVCPNTENIISMYPILNKDAKDVDILNCDYDKLFKRYKKEKNMSRVDMFNKKYNMNKTKR